MDRHLPSYQRLQAYRSLIAGCVAGLLALSSPEPTFADSADAWVNSLWPTAKSAGISRKVFDAALGDFTPDPDVLRRAGAQAEFTMPLGIYIGNSVSDERIADGKAMLKAHGDALARIESRYGVDRYIVLAIWGIESHYGKVFEKPGGAKETIRSLATLAYAGGSRAKYGRQQLIAAMKIVQHGDVSVKGMTGSWAGAMGLTQFIPTTYAHYAVDFDGDGRRNVWTSVPDALASTANYLRSAKWQGGKTWGYEVVLPAGFDQKRAGARDRSLAEWRKLGVTRPGGKAFPRPGDRAGLFAPYGGKGPAFLVLQNFRVIKRYNNANSYALAVGYLADRLRGGSAFAADWPEAERPLTAEQRARIQQLLADRGLYSGEIDGKMGSGSRDAIKAYQQKAGLPGDGFDSLRLLQQLEADK
jgi:membrane-bound lytic murein transglycosylase B